MQVDDVLLSRLEKLSHLHIDEKNREEVIEQLSEIVAFVDNLSELDTQDVSDTFSMSNLSTITREDTPTCVSKINDDILNHAPNSADRFFIVPKIIE